MLPVVNRYMDTVNGILRPREEGVYIHRGYQFSTNSFWIVHKCRTPCTTAVHDSCSAVGAADSSPSLITVAGSKWCFLGVWVSCCGPVSRPVPVVMSHRHMPTPGPLEKFQ